MHVKPYQIVILILLSIAVATFDVLGIGLLVPLAQGITGTGFTAAQLPEPLSKTAGFFFRNTNIKISPALIFFILAGTIFLTNLLGIIVTFIYTYYGRYLQGKYQWHLHTFVYNRYFSFGKLFFDKTSHGTIKKVLEYTNSSVQLVRISQNNLASLTQLIGYLAVMTWLSWRLMIMVLLIFPLLYLTSRQIMKKVNTLWRQAKEVTMDLSRESFNILSSLPLVWSYSQEEQSKKHYAQMNEKFRKVQLKAEALGYFTILIPRLITVLTLFFVVAYIAFSIHRDNGLDLTRIIIFLYVASRTVPLFKVFNSIWVAISEMTPPLLEIIGTFNNKGKYIVREGSTIFTGLQNKIRISNLSFTYEGREPVLRHVSFNVPKGQLTALVGPSGSGKSTIINLLMRFYECPPRTIFFDNTDIRDLDFKSLRQHIAIVDQDPILLHDSLKNNLTYSQKEVSDQQLQHIISQVQLNELINRLEKGLDTVIGDRGVQLSGGEKQRVAIARALIKKAEIILLDEATSALDSATERYIQNTMNTVFRNKTLLLIAHRLSTIKNASQVIYLEHGEIKEHGTLTQLISLNGQFAKQWKTQMSASFKN
ncbi:MAG: ABC transporter ATP-binding protein [bacterium]|nr:ABC transporter ATP-binding protein [bacterium]